MKNFSKNRGSIIINSFIMSAILLVFLVSTLTLFLNDFYIVKSNENSIKAYYLGEAALNKTVFKINNAADKVIRNYLLELKNYKINYIKNKIIDKNTYHPPVFSTYLQAHLLSQIASFNEKVKKPFSYYAHDHAYNIRVSYNLQNNRIDILTMGIYNGAKKFIYAQVKLPHVCNNGVDKYNLPKIKITPIILEESYLTFKQ
ncbi:hypothetical protein [Crassaminicella indica]|uniref:Type 4 fimbrial biogenesis protein PilX N-terminal domain-containing protein n=1 Tax=Crassaminicella indica TaxID=2855394 RepID=A0ABX8RE49_9CLOT|nr:hypothetical protein [Crassaminicella indica]QXM06010.1 hypothetical protein KVH43_11725 [Crassaminicella indica]